MSFEFSFQLKKEIEKEGASRESNRPCWLIGRPRKQIFSEVQVDDRGGDAEDLLEKAKKTICMVLMSLTAMVTTNETQAGSYSEEFLPDLQVVGREHKILGVIEKGKVFGALKEGVVSGTIQDEAMFILKNKKKQ